MSLEHAKSSAVLERAEPGRFWFTGGGTGGHVTPNLALIAEIRQRDPKAEIRYAGTRHGFESRVQDSGIPFVRVPCAPLVSPRSPLRFAAMVGKIILGVCIALVHIARFRPEVVIASGGYVSVPSVLAAWLLRRRIYVHEQNVDPGRANRLLAQLATRVSVSFHRSLGSFRLDRVEHAGYPLRRAIQEIPRPRARAALGLPESAKVVVVVGGSMGARSINRGLVASLEDLLRTQDLVIFHATGLAKGAAYDAHADTMARVQTLKGLKPEELARYRSQPFFEDIGTVFAAADLVVARAGAGTIMELAAMGKPALLIPKTGLPGEHQLRNALTMKEAGAAEILYEEIGHEPGEVPSVSGKALADRVRRLANDDQLLETMGRNALRVAVPDATRRHVDRILSLRHGDAAPRIEVLQDGVGMLQDARGERHELLFRAHRVGTARASDLVLDRAPGEPAVGATIVRSRVDEKTCFALHPGEGPLAVDGVKVTGPRALTPGETIEFGNQALRFLVEPRSIRRAASSEGLAKGGILTALGTMASRVFGCARDLVLAIAFGAGAIADIWMVGLQVANWLRGVFAEVAIDSAFLPTYLHLLRTGRTDQAQRLLGSVGLITLVGTGAISLFAILTLPIWLPWIATGLAAHGYMEDAILATRVMFPYLVLVSLAAIASALLRAADRWSVPAFSSIWFSVGALIGFALVPTMGVAALGFGVLLGGLGQILAHVPALRSKDVRARLGLDAAKPTVALQDPAVRKVRRMLPVILAEVSILKIGAFVDLALAGHMGLGSIAALGLAMTIFRLPYGVLSQSINSLVLRRASDLQADADSRRSLALLEKGVAWTAFLLLPATLLLTVLAEPITRLLLEYGRFTPEATRATAAALAGYGLGLLGWGLMGLAGRMLHARLEQRIATRTSLIALVLNIVLSIAFVQIGWGLFGIAFATSISYLIGAGLRLRSLLRSFESEGAAEAGRAIRTLLVRHGLALLPAAAVTAAAAHAVRGFETGPLFFARLAEFLIPATFGGVAFLACGVILRLPALQALEQRFSRPGDRKRQGPGAPVNPFCLMPPERLLKWVETNPQVASQFPLTPRVQQMLASRDWTCRNSAVKLASQLGDPLLVPALQKLVRCRRAAPLVHRLLGGDFQEPGFVRRNAVQALARIDHLDADVEDTLITALQDPYWEVRCAAARALSSYGQRLSQDARARACQRLAVLAKAGNFEAAQDSVRTLGELSADASVMDLLKGLHYHQNWRVRRAVVQAYQRLYERGMIADKADLSARLDDVLVTSEGFVPRFELKESLVQLKNRLRAADRGSGT